MARVTVEDCEKHTEGNRFQLVIKAADRARQIEGGASALVDTGQDKPTVVALKEIEQGLLETLEQQRREEKAQQLVASAQQMPSDGDIILPPHPENERF